MKQLDYHLVTAIKPEGFVFPKETRRDRPPSQWTDENWANHNWLGKWYGIDREFKVLEAANMAVKVHKTGPNAKACATKLRNLGFEATVTKMEMVPQ